MPRTALIRIAAITSALLAIPLVAMRLTDQVDWQPGDFIVAAVLLIGGGVAYELLAPEGKTITHRAVAGVGVVAVVLVVWMVLAVGLD